MHKKKKLLFFYITVINKFLKKLLVGLKRFRLSNKIYKIKI